MTRRLAAELDTTWQASAACKGQTESFFDEHPRVQRKALELCASCEVKAECLEHVMATEDRANRFGIAGGLLAADRYRLAGKVRFRRTVEVCSHGHPYDEVNTYRRPDGTRDCRVCRRRRSKEAKRMQRAGAS